MASAAIVLILGVVFLAYANGANDNFKGVATLFGSGAASYRGALTWATVTTFAGSIGAIFMAGTLVSNFSGKGLVPDAVAGSPELLQAVILGAGLCVMLATWIGFPISTTHALTGGLVGAGLMAVGAAVNLGKLMDSFLIPLLVSPFIAVALAGVAYFILHRLRLRSRIDRTTCVCIGGEYVPVTATSSGMMLQSAGGRTPKVIVSDTADCAERYTGRVVGISAQKLMDGTHFLSAGVVSFARGLNDTPKVVAALIGVQAIGIRSGMLIVGVAMAVGGLLNARKVAHKVSKEITKLNHGQGLTSNLVTGFLVVFASRMGMPVSTTHVSCGALFGIGTVTGQGNLRVVTQIVLAWVLTLPISALFAAIAFRLLSS